MITMIGTAGAVMEIELDGKVNLVSSRLHLRRVSLPPECLAAAATHRSAGARCGAQQETFHAPPAAAPSSSRMRRSDARGLAAARFPLMLGLR